MPLMYVLLSCAIMNVYVVTRLSLRRLVLCLWQRVLHNTNPAGCFLKVRDSIFSVRCVASWGLLPRHNTHSHRTPHIPWHAYNTHYAMQYRVVCCIVV